jgi:hypothetical protein
MKAPTSTEEANLIIERFETMPIDRRIEIFRQLSPRAREELIEIVSRPGEIVRRVSEEEMYFTIKELGDDYAPSLIAATTGSQLRYLLDLELWTKDVFDDKAALKWMGVVAEIGPEKTLQFMQIVDPELLVLVLRPFVRVTIRRPEIDLLEQRDELPVYTLDDLFFIEFPAPDSEMVVRSFLETLYRWNQEYYLGIMEELAHGIGLENEELALKWRAGRLADHGFPGFEEAVEIYRYQKPEVAFAGSGYSKIREEEDSGLSHQIFQYPLQLVDGKSLLNSCLAQIEDASERDAASMEMAHLANKVMIADGREPGSIEEIHNSLEKVGGYVNMALEEACDVDVSSALDMLRSSHMEVLFRRGFTMVLDLRKEAWNLAQKSEGGMDNLGSPLTELVKWLLNKRPLYAAHVHGHLRPREFRSISEIEYIRGLMASVLDADRWEPV